MRLSVCLIVALVSIIAIVNAVPFTSSANQIYVQDVDFSSTLMPSIGNGYVSTFIGANDLFIGGLFNGFLDIAPSHRAIIPSPVNYTVVATDSSISLINNGYLFDIEKATFSHYLTISGNNGAQLGSIEQRWYAHQDHRSLIVHEVHVNNTLNVNTFSFTLDDSLNGQFNSPDIGFARVLHKVAVPIVYGGAILQPEAINGQKVNVAVCFTNSSVIQTVPAKSSAVFYYLSTYRTDIAGDSQFPVDDAILDWNTYSNMNATLYNSHVMSWAKLWAQGGIEVDGSGSSVTHLQQVTNTSLYWIYQSIRADWPWSLSPGSLASNGYNGHAFWDTETWMYPTIMMLNTDLGKALLQYRANHRAGASRKAYTYSPHYDGTMFPWEDAFSGNEVCPIGVGTCRFEQHISGDIAYAVQQYWSNTHDLEWLDAIGFPLVYDICVFWASRVANENGVYVIDGVIPPDEYHTGVNNSVYTNVVAVFSFDFAAAAGQILGIPTPANWQTIARNMKIPFDVAEQIHLEYDGYTNETIKQADVILLGFPLMYNMTKAIRANDLNFYSAVTDINGPAMTWSMTAVGYLELQEYDTAYQYFLQGYANAQSPFQVWTETPTGGTVNFITGCGGFLQSMLFGYPGLRLHEDYILFGNVTLPTDVTSLKLRGMDYRGSVLDITVQNVSAPNAIVDICITFQGPTPLYYSYANNSATLRPSLNNLAPGLKPILIAPCVSVPVDGVTPFVVYGNA